MTDKIYAELMDINYDYPDQNDLDLQNKLYTKREFHVNKIQGRDELKNEDDVKKLRKQICTRKTSLMNHQILLSQFINPNTPYDGVLIFHGTGTGKCLLGDTLVMVNDKLTKISDIWDNYAQNLIYDGEGYWSNIKSKLIVNSLDTAINKTLLQPINRLYRQLIKEDIKIVTLENGLKIKLTLVHKLYTKKNMDDTKTWSNRFKVGDSIYVPTNYNIINNLTTKINYKVISDKLPIDIFTWNKEKINIYMSNYIQLYGDRENNIIKFRGKYEQLLHLYYIFTLLNKTFKIDLHDDNVGYLYDEPLNLNNKFIKIVDIQYEKFNGYVYDLEITGYHNFMANGLIASNTCLGITVGEKFKSVVQKYNTKIYVLVPGPLVKRNWQTELLKCTGDTYLAKTNTTEYVTDAVLEQNKKAALAMALQYWKFLSYKSFYKKVLGEKIKERVKVGSDKSKTIYRKTADGKFERDVSMDRIYNLDNSVLIVDEAHNLTGTNSKGNSYGEALMHIRKKSKNLKIILLTATPMKNLADDIIPLLNFIRPIKMPIQREFIFTSEKNHEMRLKPGGKKYLEDMSRGYVSYLRGADPLTFAERNEVGEISKGLSFTKVIKCYMLDFQKKTYYETLKQSTDALDRKTEAVSNFAFPGLTPDGNDIIGYYGKSGMTTIKNQLLTKKDKLNELIKTKIIKKSEDDEFIRNADKNLSGAMLKKENLKFFSIKFSTALDNILQLFDGKKGARNAFIYSNLVKVGIDLFKMILLENGFLEFEDDASNYDIDDNTICYKCGLPNKGHDDVNFGKLKMDDHKFYPSAFITVTGKSDDDSEDILPEKTKDRIDNIFNNIDNKEGKHIKLILGSKVMSEAISLFNIGEIHILDVYYNLGRVEQVIGRGIRNCSHYYMINEKNKNPKVDVYKYVVGLKNEMTTEEILYKKAEEKFLLVKQVERIMKQAAFDCPLNHHGNIFPEELTKYKDCVEPKSNSSGNQNNKLLCPVKCDYTKCNYKCTDKLLNNTYYDEKRGQYIDINKVDLDYTTFSYKNSQAEISIVKEIIKDLYRIKTVYTINDIIETINKNRKDNEIDKFFVYMALDELTPTTENDFNTFIDIVYDKFNRRGFIKQYEEYYIFQEFGKPTDLPMYYRSSFMDDIKSTMSLYNYMRRDPKFDIVDENMISQVKTEFAYDFETVLNYYNNRKEYKYVGIIDSETNKSGITKDVFKIREARGKNSEMESKRKAGIPSLKGSVCATSKEKSYLLNILKDLKIDTKNIKSIRKNLCGLIKEKLFFLEKYSTSAAKNKKTYFIVPYNHPTLKFPVNLEDRVEHVMEELKDTVKIKLNIKVTNVKKIINKVPVTTYIITIPFNEILLEYDKFFDKFDTKKSKQKYIINIE